MSRQHIVLLALLLVACTDPISAPDAAPGTQRVVALSSSSFSPIHWGLDRIDQTNLPLSASAYYQASRGAGVRIYILDSGIWAIHPELIGRVTLGVDLTGGDGSDCYGHGTGVASLAAGTTTGVAPEAQIINVRFSGCTGTASTADVVAAIQWVQNNVVHPAVALLTWTDPIQPNDPMTAAVESAVAAGVPFVLAAGNLASNACNESPAATPSALTVAASTATDTRFSGSNYGACVDLFAPGHQLVAASGTAAYHQSQGTSDASAMVAGAVAILLSTNPTLTPADINTAILGGASSGVLTGLPAGTPNLLLRLPDSIDPPPHNATFATACTNMTCTFTAVEAGLWKIGLVADSGLTASRTFPFSDTYVVRHTVDGNAAEQTVTCNNKKCR